MLDFIFSLVILTILLVIYLAPTIVAYNRSNNQLPAIFILNVALGWTFVGWIAALVWSVYKSKEVKA